MRQADGIAFLGSADIDDEALGAVPREAVELLIATASETLRHAEGGKIAGDRPRNLPRTRDVDHIDTQCALELLELGQALRPGMHCPPR